MCDRVKKDDLIAFLESTMAAAGDFRKRSDEQSPERVIRSKNLKKSVYKDTRINENGQVEILFETAASTYDEDGKTYKNLIVVPGLATAYKNNPSYTTIAGSLKNQDVQVKCSCKDFKYRFEYWLNQDKDLARTDDPDEKITTTNAPNVTNPNNDKGSFCKHLLKVTSVFLFNISKIKNDLSNVNFSSVVEKKDTVTEGAIVLKKNTETFMDSITESKESISDTLQKDTGLTEVDRDEIEEVLTKDVEPEKIEEDGDEAILEKDDEDIKIEPFDETNLQKFNEIEPFDTEEIQPLEKDKALDGERSEVDTSTNII